MSQSHSKFPSSKRAVGNLINILIHPHDLKTFIEEFPSEVTKIEIIVRRGGFNPEFSEWFLIQRVVRCSERRAWSLDYLGRPLGWCGEEGLGSAHHRLMLLIIVMVMVFWFDSLDTVNVLRLDTLTLLFLGFWCLKRSLWS